jgi:glucokinase
MSVIGIDVGGTGIKAARLEGTAIAQRRDVPTPAAGVPEAIAAVAAELMTDAVTAVGVVVPGVVADGVVHYSANLAWRDVPLRHMLTDALGRPVAVGHDVTAAGLAEADGGDLLYVSVGTGIGGAVVAAGQLMLGARSLAGEIGHVPVWPDGEPCACGQRGCLETYASAAAVARRHGAVSSAADVVARLGQDARADEVWTTATTALGIALAGATLLLDPPRIVLGGGLAQAGDALLEPVRTELARRLAWRPAPPVAGAAHGADAGIRGAALLAELGKDGQSR